MEEIATVYARSLFEVALERDEVDTIRDELGQFADALDAEPQLRTFFFSPYFSTPEKKDALHKAVTEADATVINFIELLIEKHRMPAIFRIRRAYDKQWEEINKRLAVTVTSAVELDEATVRHIGDRIGEQTGRTVELSARVEPDILGGIIVQVGNSIIDASIRSRLERLRKQVARAQ